MREIKFRAWDKKNNGMIYGGIQENEAFWLMVSKGREMYIPMQYTGLKDKKGKEIYEGDVTKRVYVGGDVNLEEIRYDTGSYVFHIPGHPEDEIMDRKNSKNCEVIGNIYENPDLIK